MKELVWGKSTISLRMQCWKSLTKRRLKVLNNVVLHVHCLRCWAVQVERIKIKYLWSACILYERHVNPTASGCGPMVDYCKYISSLLAHGAKNRPPRCRGFENTLGHTTFIRASPDEWSARRIDISTWQHTTLTMDRYPCPCGGFHPAIPADEWPQAHALNCLETGTGCGYKALTVAMLTLQ